MPNEAHEFALRLRTQMERRHVTQSELAQGIGVSTVTAYKYYHGIVMPKALNVKRIVKFLGCTYQDLLGL